MKKIVFLLVIILFSSCNYIQKSVPNEKELLEKELKSINWNQVDHYPSISSCDSLVTKELQKQCFFNYLKGAIQQKLNTNSLKIINPKIDTIQVKITVLPNSTLVFEPQFSTDSLSYTKKKMDSILKVKLVDFLKINPAMKRGIPVKTQFILPVVLNRE